MLNGTQPSLYISSRLRRCDIAHYVEITDLEREILQKLCSECEDTVADYKVQSEDPTVLLCTDCATKRMRYMERHVKAFGVADVAAQDGNVFLVCEECSAGEAKWCYITSSLRKATAMFRRIQSIAATHGGLVHNNGPREVSEAATNDAMHAHDMSEA